MHNKLSVTFFIIAFIRHNFLRKQLSPHFSGNNYENVTLTQGMADFIARLFNGINVITDLFSVSFSYNSCLSKLRCDYLLCSILTVLRLVLHCSSAMRNNDSYKYYFILCLVICEQTIHKPFANLSQAYSFSNNPAM